MKVNNQKFFSVTLLLSCLAILNNCNWSNKDECSSCSTDTTNGMNSMGIPGQNQKLTGEALLLIDNKPVITTDSFEEYWKMLIGDDPNAAAIASFYPNARGDVFKNRLVPSQIILHWIEETKKNENPLFKKKLQAMYEMVATQLAEQALQEEIVSSLDTSDETLTKFYEEEKKSNPVFAQAPFMVEPEGIKAESVKFTTEKSANEFADKAKKDLANFKSLAKESKKEVKDLGVVSAQSKLDFALKNKIESMEPNSVAVVNSGKASFEVIKTGAKQEGKWAPAKDVLPSIKQAYIQTKGTEEFNKKIDELKKKYNVVENLDFFEKEKNKKQAEMEEQFKAIQKQQDEASKDTEKNIDKKENTKEDNKETKETIKEEKAK